MRRSAGLTLVEIMVTLAILALLMALAVPSFTPLLERWRVQQSVSAMTDTIQLARSEAIKRGGNVAIQKNANNTQGCTLATTNADWGCGWLVFVDGNADGVLAANEEILQSTLLPPGIQVEHSSNTATMTVDRWGKMDGLSAKRFVVFPLAAGRASPATRSICVSAGGRIRITESATC